MSQNLLSLQFDAAQLAQVDAALIDAYNSGATSTENYYDELTAYAQELKDEAERHIREGLTEDELELFDLLK